MKVAAFIGSAFAAALIALPAMAATQAEYGRTQQNPSYDQSQGPTGMTGHYRGWDSAHGSGSGANNFVGNGNGHPEQSGTQGNPGGWFANNHQGGGH